MHESKEAKEAKASAKKAQNLAGKEEELTDREIAFNSLPKDCRQAAIKEGWDEYKCKAVLLLTENSGKMSYGTDKKASYRSYMGARSPSPTGYYSVETVIIGDEKYSDDYMVAFLKDVKERFFTLK